MKKKLTIVVAAVALMCCFVQASNMLTAQIVQFKVFVDGQEKEFDMPIVVIDDRTYVPLREVSETLNMYVNWNDGRQEIEINSSGLFPFKEDVADWMWGYVDRHGNVRIEPKYFSADEFSEGLACVRTSRGQDGKYGFINTDGEVAIPCIYYMARSFRDGIAWISVARGTDDSSCSYIDKQGKRITDKYFMWGSDFSEGYAIVQTVGLTTPAPKDIKDMNRYTYINKQCEYATNMEFEEAKSFKNGYAYVKNNGKWGKIDTEFNLVIDYLYDEDEIKSM